MHTKSSLIEDFQKAGIDSSSTLLVHSSMKAIGEVEGGAETVIDAFIDYMVPGLLLFPTHSWSETNLKNAIYNPLVEPSCVGLLSNLFKERPGTYRSLHPTHSVAAIGERAKTYVSRDDVVHTPCPRSGCFGGLYDEEAYILFLGAPLTSNTYIHSLEEMLEIPDRLAQKPRQITIQLSENESTIIELYGHNNSHGDVSKNYDKIKEALLYKGIAKEVVIGDARSYLIEVKPMADLVVGFLNKDPDLFVDKRPVIAAWYK